MSVSERPVNERKRRKTRVGELVEVRSKAEILATLDKDGSLDSLPFMPEMLKYCGMKFRVSKRAHKTCDTIHSSGGRRMANTVHLEDLRCDGEAHGGCQAGCSLFWKESWLKLVPAGAGDQDATSDRVSAETLQVRDDVLSNGTRQNSGAYRCQATELLKATAPLKWWEPSQYIEDVTSGNTTILRLVEAMLFFLFKKALKVGGYRALIAGYNWMQMKRGGIPFPYRDGRLRGSTPSDVLNLKQGEVVEIKSHDEILETVNERNRNRGLSFDPEMVKYCGGKYRVLRRVERVINEKTGEMMPISSDCIILDGVTCGAHFSHKRLFCPRGLYPFWREVWLKRTSES